MFVVFFCVGPSCRHIKKGTDQTLLKKLSGDSDLTSCQDCNHEENKENISNTLQQDSEQEQETPVVWMCLKCGHRVSLFNPFILKILTVYEVTFLLNDQMYLFYQGCGRNSENQHAIKHYETPRSDPHCLVICLDSWSVWWVCYCGVLITETYRVCLKWEVPVHFFFAKPPGVTYVMTKSSTPERDIWLSWWPNLKNKPLRRRVGPIEKFSISV